MKKTICVDFDGVLHSYVSGWKGATTIPDPPVPLAMEWLADMSNHYIIAIYSARSACKGGIEAIREWVRHHMHHYIGVICGFEDAAESITRDILSRLNFPTEKPQAIMYIDDRAFCFRGTFPTNLEIEHFKPWNK